MKPLEGLLVVSLEQAVAAPFCSSRLVQAGARVIKIEREEGDFARGYDEAAKGESSYFVWLNQGKESVCLDFKTEAGFSLLCNILAKADVLIQNLSPGALSRAGLSSEKLHALNDRLIICNISGYGPEGEVSKKPAYDLLVQAESGIISVSGSPDSPGRVGVSICDIGTGVTAYSGILEALLQRSITGKGSEFSISLFDVAVDWMAVPYIHAEYGNGSPKPAGLKHPSIAPYGAFATADARLVLISIQNEREWKRLCLNVLDCERLFNHESYQTNTLRVHNREALETDITKITMTLTSTEFQKRLQEAKIAYGALNEPSDLKTHDAFRAVEYQNSQEKKLMFAAHPVNWNEPDDRTTRRAPRLGEHTRQIEQEFKS